MVWYGRRCATVVVGTRAPVPSPRADDKKKDRFTIIIINLLRTNEK